LGWLCGGCVVLCVERRLGDFLGQSPTPLGLKGN
jgi:hypothetical protein